MIGVQMGKQIGIYVFDEVEALDFAGPYEVLTTASRVAKRMGLATSALFEVVVIGQTMQTVKARAGMGIMPDQSITDHLPLDVLIVPGGVVTRELAKTDVIAWVQRMAQQVPLVASVCTGAFVLAEAGLLNGLTATTHWEDIPDLQAQYPTVTVRQGVRWVDQGHIVTSAGISAGIDMSLHLVERLGGRALAAATARQMEFDWTENPAVST